MKNLLYFLLAFLLASCATSKPVQTSERTETDRTYSAHLDSLLRASMARDSIVVRDSVYVFQKGDTVTQYVEKWRYRYRTNTDTIYKVTLLCDTVYMERTRDVEVEKPVYVEKKVPWYDRGAIWIGRLAVVIICIWLLFCYLKREI